MTVELNNLKWLIRIYTLKFLGWYNKMPLKRFYKFFNNKKNNDKINIVHYINHEYIIEYNKLCDVDIAVLKFLNKILKFNKFFKIKPFIIVDDQIHKIKYKNKELLDKMFRDGFASKLDQYLDDYIWAVNSVYLKNNKMFDYKKDYDNCFIDMTRDLLHTHDLIFCRCDFFIDQENRFPVLKYHFDKLIK